VLVLSATIAAALLQVIWTLPPLLRLFPPAPARAARDTWNRAAWPTLLADLATIGRQNADLILLGLLAPPAVVGVYFAATRIASLIGLVEFAIGASFGHRFAREAAAGRSNAAFREARHWMRLAGLGGALVLGAATPMILMLFGESFTAAIWPAWLLLAATAIRMAQGPLEDLLTTIGFPAEVWRANLIGALVTTILCLLLAGPWQAIGAAIGAAMGNLATGLILELAHRRRLGTDRAA
jgi:O-antigen/teichoic acid export membrane protein